MKGWSFCQKQNITRAIDAIVNLATVNYLLRGLQTDMGENQPSWDSFLMCTGWPVTKETYTPADFRGGPYQHRNVSMFIQDFIRPLGVVIGSEMQGGQHQGSGGAVDFPVDHVVTILVDGLCDNMLNMWKRTDIKAGDDLLLALCGYQMHDDTHYYSDGTKTMHAHRKKGPLLYQFNIDKKVQSGGLDFSAYAPPTDQTSYVLNHWAKGRRSEKFAKAPNLHWSPRHPLRSTRVHS
jgi:hypothetical protein